MSTARLLLGMAFAISFGGALYMAVALIEINSSLPNFWHPGPLDDRPLRDVIQQKATKALYEVVLGLTLSVVPAVLVSILDQIGRAHV